MDGTPSPVPVPVPGPARPSAQTRIGRLRIRHLQLLDAIDSQGSLTAAAGAIGVSQPGATNLLHDLEAAFGRSLLDRSYRGGRLSKAGRVALERLRIALGALDAARADLEAGDGPPIVRIGVLPLVGVDALSQVVAGLEARGRLPRMSLRVGVVDELLTLLARGEVDCVISSLNSAGSAPLDTGRLDCVRLWEERLVVVAAADHPLTTRRKVSLDELRRHPWVLMARRSTNRSALERMFLTSGLAPPEATIEAESLHVGITMVARSRMLALVPDSACRPGLAPIAPIARIALEHEFERFAVNLVTLKGLPTLPFVTQLARLLKRNEAPRGRRAGPHRPAVDSGPTP